MSRDSDSLSGLFNQQGEGITARWDAPMMMSWSVFRLFSFAFRFSFLWKHHLCLVECVGIHHQPLRGRSGGNCDLDEIVVMFEHEISSESHHKRRSDEDKE